MRNTLFNKMDDHEAGKFEEQTSNDYVYENDKQPEFDVIGTALNEI